MKCKDITEKIDLGQVSTGLIGKMRFLGHLAFCRACRNYLAACRVLKRAALGLINTGETRIDINNLNKSLTQKFVKKN